MSKTEDLFAIRKSLDEICTVPDRIISVYSLEKHVWADSNSPAAREKRQPEIQTIHEFQIDPVRPFLNDILRRIAAPYKPERKDNPVGQGYWIQAEFGSGKSHLLCFLSALGLGSEEAWEFVRGKEQKAGRGKRESLYQFWEEGIKAKSTQGRGIFVIVKTLVGVGGGTVGIEDKGRRLTEYILDAAKEQLELEVGKNLSLYPAELLADRFLNEDLARYRNDLKKFLRDSRFFEEDEFEEIDDFIHNIQQNKSPEYKRSCGDKLWRFYDEYLKVRPQIAAETEDILKHLIDTVMAEGYSGVLLVLDEISLFMKDRDDDQRQDDEKTLVVLSNRLAKVHSLPVWTVCSAQQAIVSRMGVGNIIADERLKLVKLLEEDKGYYEIVLSRVREIKDPGAISNYYLHYKHGFTWPNSIGEQEFDRFFPFHRPALEVVRAITYELTTARSAIHFMHQTLKHQVKNKGREVIRLWELFDEAVRYEEDPSGVHAGIAAIQASREADYKAYEACKRQIEAVTKGPLKVHRDKAVKTVQTLFLYHIGRTRQKGITPEEIANSILIGRDEAENPDENIQHYETIADNLRRELPQIVQSFDDEKRPLYRFEPVIQGINPSDEFEKARDEAESNQLMQQLAWQHLLALGEWPIRTRQMTIDLSNGVKSIFSDIAPFGAQWKDKSKSGSGVQPIDIVWQGRQVQGRVEMRNLTSQSTDNLPLPSIDTDQTDQDFAVFVADKPVSADVIAKLLVQRKDPRIILWTPADLTADERDRLIDFAAYRKLISSWQGKDSEDAATVISWVAEALRTDLGKIAKVVDNSYARGRIDAPNNSQMEFHVAGELPAILTPIVSRVLSAAYESRDIKFDHPFIFKKEEGAKVINGIVRTGSIPKGAKPDQSISAAQNFGFALKIMKKSSERELDVSDNRYASEMWSFIDDKLDSDSSPMKVETLYKNFMGIGGPKDYGLTRRMVQIYLLCLARQGKIRVALGPKSGLPFSFIDYSNIAGIDFSTKVLDALTEVHKLAKPENWEVLRPYAEKLLDESIPSTHDDAAITVCRTKLRHLFEKEREESSRVLAKAASLFETLKASNPYEKEMQQVAKLFAKDITGGDDIQLLLHGLKEAFGYRAFEDEAVSEPDVDDLANRLQDYRNVKGFLAYETDIRAAHAYCSHSLPDDDKQLDGIRRLSSGVALKLADIRRYIDSDVALRTELVGHVPPATGETGTIGELIHEYTSLYVKTHDAVMEWLEKEGGKIRDILRGDEFGALRVLEGITVLQPPVSQSLEKGFAQQMAKIFTCPNSSPISIREQLKTGPVHECGLTFGNAFQHISYAESLAGEARSLFDQAVNQKMEVFLNPAIRERLAQGEAAPVIAGLLKCECVVDVRALLLKACLEEPDVVATINRYLKKIVVKQVKVAGFKPSLGTVERNQIEQLGHEFRKYLEEQMASIEGDGDTLPMLQIE
ncbi:MAG: hypothetical protein M1358_15150 [Chloroflexi bacterium]|nr:hypothetical protein [Chloroflexota bacterium]